MSEKTPAPRGYSWPPFEPGHELSMTHGAYASAVRLGPRVAELADELRASIPAGSPVDETALRLLCVALARLEASSAALADASPAELARLRADERGWVNTARRLLNDLGLTPTSRARLGVDVARGSSLAAAMQDALDARERADARMADRGEEVP